ncbi:MAG TPA: adenylosuccinate synthase [Bacteroidia bacterium]|nr:adenylosuccinate synthase [Bacteroidia bacterium]HNT80980.1 adenylosuccinate synthase [Bacteroidia bacterium]
MKVDVLLGLQWGDEGKGKIVDVLAPQYEMIARFQGGPNAGHTLEFDGIKHVLHTIPSGIFHPGKINLVGNGVVIDPIVFQKEIKGIEAKGVQPNKNLFISRKAHLILPTHKLLDAASEAMKGEAKIGSTLKGIGPAYMDKTGRNGLRVGDIEARDFDKRFKLLVEKHKNLLQMYKSDAKPDSLIDEWLGALDSLRGMNLVNGEYFVNEHLLSGRNILAEGAQGSLLDIDFGSYPFVTSSNTITAGTCTGLGIAPSKIGEVYGIFKAYCTRVGSGPFPTELEDETGERMRKAGNEFGATTGRPRRCGWLDLPALKYACMLNGVTQLIMTKSDVLNAFDEIKVATAYNYENKSHTEIPFDICNVEITPTYETREGWEVDFAQVQEAHQLPQQLAAYILYLEEELKLPISYVSVGPDRTQILTMKSAVAF